MYQIYPFLLGTERIIACANEKYHTDWLWTHERLGDLLVRTFLGLLKNENCMFMKINENIILTVFYREIWLERNFISSCLHA